MYRLTVPLQGSRWRSDDFLKGRNKVRGAVHKRSILGWRGRYKDWKKTHGLRDGNHHVHNNTKGALGMKIGAGLFGLRVPRNVALKDMTAGDLDLELSGHPNITNPYRYRLDDHPALDRVLENPLLSAIFVVAMPRNTPFSRGQPDALPKSWEDVVPALQQFKASHAALLDEVFDSVYDAERGGDSSASPSSDVHDVAELSDEGGELSSIGASHVVLASPYDSIVLNLDPNGDVRGDLVQLWKAHRAAMTKAASEEKTDVKPSIDYRKNSSVRDITLLRRSTPLPPALATAAAAAAAAVHPEHAAPVNLLGVVSKIQQELPGSLRLVSHIDGCTGAPNSSPVNSLLRWFFYSNDPRSAIGDVVSNGRKVVPCAVLVRTEGLHDGVERAVRSRFGFQFVDEDVTNVAAMLAKWSLEGTSAPRGEHVHSAACGHADRKSVV